MGTQALTHQMIAREAAKMYIEENSLIKSINTGRSDEFGQAVQGYKKGDFVDIGVPPVPVVFDGAQFAGGGAAPSLAEKKVRLQLDTQKHVALTFTAKEKKLDLTDFSERFLRPSMQSLISIVQADLLDRYMVQVPGQVGTWGTVPADRAPYSKARSYLERNLAPTGNRTVLFSSDASEKLTAANATLFHDGKEIRGEFDDGAVGRFGGFDYFENQSLPLATNGAGASYVVDAAAQTGAALVVKTGTGAIPKGTVFTITGVNAVHPITGVSNGTLRQFVVTADFVGGAGSVSIYPAITPTTATVVGTVDASPAASAPITIFGTASQAKRQNLAFHKDAFAAAFAPLPVIASCDGYTATIQNVSVRVMTGGDFTNDRESTRIDVLYGAAVVRPDHAVRISE